MTASSRPPSSPAGKSPVVVCCARGDAESLRGELASLEQEGHPLTLVEGLDEEPRRLIEVIEQHGGEGLYVLCRSPRLDREVVEALREILLAQHVPFARTLTVAVGRGGSMSDRIRAGLRRASTTSRSSSSPAAATTPPRRPAAPAIDDEPTLVGVRSEDLVPIDDDQGEDDGDTAAKPPPAPPSSVATLVSTTDGDSGVRARPIQRIDSAQLIGDPSGAMRAMRDLDFSDLDGLGETPNITAVGSPPPHITGDTVIGPMPAMITGSTLVGHKLPASLREAAERAFRAGASPLPRRPAPSGAEPEVDPATTPFTPISAAALQQPMRPRPTAPAPAPPRVAASASTSAAAPIGSASGAPVAAASASGAPVAAASISGAPVAAASISRGAMAAVSGGGAAASMPGAPAYHSHAGTPVAEPGATPPRQVLPWVLGVVALGLLVLVISLAVRGGDGDAPELASESSESTEASETTPPQASETTPPQASEDEDEPPAPPLYPVVVALQSRKVRALDVLLIANDPSDPGDYSTADAYCAQLEIEGLGDWRLPLVGELNSLSAAKMIGRGTYWSSTAADTFGDSHLAWNVARGHALPYDDNAIAVCVRGPGSGT